MADLAVVCWLWNDGSRDFRPQHAATVARMFRRHLPVEHRFVCITDDAKEIDGVDVMPTPPAALALGRLRTPEGAGFPSCYRRLWMFSDEAQEIAKRVLLVDIDVILLRDVSPLVQREEDFVGWQPSASWGQGIDRIGGGLYLLRTGTRTDVLTRFQGAPSIAEARAAGYRGSDQAWLSYVLHGCPLYGPEAGIYSIRDMKNGRLPPPSDARIVQHNGTRKPWSSPVPWVRRAWRMESR